MPALINPVYCGSDDSPGGHRAPQYTQQWDYGRDFGKGAGTEEPGQGLTDWMTAWQLILLLISTTDTTDTVKWSDGNRFISSSGNVSRHSNAWVEKTKTASVAKNTDVAYSRGKANIIAQQNLQYAYPHFHVDGRLPSHLNIMSS